MLPTSGTRSTGITSLLLGGRVVRRVVPGNGARDDHKATDLLAALRSDANWAYLRPRHAALRQHFLARRGTYVDMAEPHSLAGLIARTPTIAETDLSSQIAHWLFAFDAAGIATFRTLALLATHPAHVTRVRQQLAGLDLSRPQGISAIVANNAGCDSRQYDRDNLARLGAAGESHVGDSQLVLPPG